MTRLMLSAALAVAAFGCTKKTEPPASETNSAAKSETPTAAKAKTPTTAKDKAETPKAKARPAKEEAEKVEQPKAPATLTPKTVDLTRPVSPKALQEGYFAWKDKEVTVTGHCDLFFDKGKVSDCTKFTAKPGEKKTMVECSLKESGVDDPVTEAELLTVKGKVKYSFWDHVQLTDCTFVARAKAPGADTAIPPAKDPVSAAALFDAVKGWKGTEVAVIGHYQSHTTSTNKHGKSVRVDLTGPDGGKIGCHTQGATPPPADLENNRDGVIMQGKVDGEAFGNVNLVDCVFKNR